MSVSLPPDILQRLDLLERLVAEQANSPQNTAKQREEWEKKLRDKSRFQGLGEPVPNPNLHAHIPYPSYRFHAVGGVALVNNAQEDAALGEGWCDSPAKALEAAAPKGKKAAA